MRYVRPATVGTHPSAFRSPVPCLALGILLANASPSLAGTIVIPGDQPTIQQGIDVAADGDTVLVMPGTYFENIVIDVEVVVRSAGGPAVTIIDGSQPVSPDSASVVRFRSFTSGSIEGFDIRNGAGTVQVSKRRGGGIQVENWYEPDIVHGPLIRDNWIHHNWLDGDITDLGAGIHVNGVARVVNNRIFDNGFVQRGWGAAMHVLREWGGHQDRVVFQGNEVFDNHAPPDGPDRRCGAVLLTGSICTDNTIACNTGGRGSAIWAGGEVRSNTIAGNWSFTEGAAVLLGVPGVPDCWGPVVFLNNNVTHNLGPGVECLPCEGGLALDLGCNNIAFNGPGGEVTGECGDVIGHDGNISIDPVYGRTGCEPGQDSWCLDATSPLLIDPPPGCGLIGALGLCPPIGVHDVRPQSPPRLQVRAPRPNPFLERTTIPFYLPRSGEVSIGIYDVMGRRIRALEPGWRTAGDHALEWDGRDDAGRRVPSGAYVARIGAGGEELTRTLLLIR
jgi:hypothetical protein